MDGLSRTTDQTTVPVEAEDEISEVTGAVNFSMIEVVNFSVDEHTVRLFLEVTIYNCGPRLHEQ